jgi:hypothetical protein
LNGLTTLSTLGGAARKSRQLVTIVTLNCGQSAWVTSFGEPTHLADFSVMRIGESPFGGMRKLELLGVVKEFFAPAWPMFLNDVLILTLNALVFGDSSRTRPILIGFC